MSARADLARGRPSSYREAPVIFTPHAVEQANDRVLRLLDLAEAERRLRWLAAERGRIATQQPAWLHKPRTRADFWLVIESPPMAFHLYANGGRGEIPAGTRLTPGQSPVGASVRWRTASGGT